MKIDIRVALLAAAGALFTACSSSSTPSTPSTPSKLFIAYTAVGASDAVGYGASVPCTTANPPLVADLTCPEPGANGYVPDIVNGLGQYGFSATLQDLGISGGVIGPDIQTLANTYDSVTGANACRPRTPASAYPANFLQNELPSVNPKATLITIFAGGNDVNGIVNALACGAGGTTVASQTAFITAQVTAFGNDFAKLVGGAHAAAPGAIIIVANIPNFANVPYAKAAPAALRAALQAISVAIDTNVINTAPSLGVPVVDVQCNPQSYVPANFYTDGFHPNTAGYALLGGLFVQQALATSPTLPAQSCSQQAIASVMREPVPVGAPFDAPRY
jgi:lysophospholipase L1-like esterase